MATTDQDNENFLRKLEARLRRQELTACKLTSTLCSLLALLDIYDFIWHQNAITDADQ